MAERDSITCEEVVAHLLEYLDGEIDAGKRSHIDRHLEECRGCCSRAEFEMALRRKIKELSQEKAPETLNRRIKALLDEF